VIVDEHVERLTLDDAPELVVIQIYITNAYRRVRDCGPLPVARGLFVCLGGLHVTSLPEEAAAHADAIFLGPGEQTFPKFSSRLSRRQTGASLHLPRQGRTLERVPRNPA